MKILLLAGALLLALVSGVTARSPSLASPNAAWAKTIVTVR